MPLILCGDNFQPTFFKEATHAHEMGQRLMLHILPSIHSRLQPGKFNFLIQFVCVFRDTFQNADEWRVYELVVRHFLACCSRDATGSETKITVSNFFEMKSSASIGRL